jgi:hypothetical protein
MRTKNVPVNAPNHKVAEAALVEELTKRNIRFASVRTLTKYTQPKPDSEVALTVTKPVGRISTYIIVVTF